MVGWRPAVQEEYNKSIMELLHLPNIADDIKATKATIDDIEAAIAKSATVVAHSTKATR